jgi:ABC-type nitrate/sulfonate/bicarbonate transport system substrate-binding protein
MMAGAAEMTQQITGTTLNAIANGANIAIVMGLQADPDYQLYGRSDVTSVQGLAGKRVASADPGSELNTLVRKTLSYYGLPPERYDIVPVGATNARYAAMTQGAVDATLLSVPLTFDAETRGFKYLGTTGDAVPNYMFTTVATKRDWARQNTDLVVRFIRGYQEFLQWMENPANKAEMVEHWEKLSGASAEASVQTYDTYVSGPLKNKVLSPNAAVDREGVQAVIDIMLESDILKRPLTVDEVVDLSYWERASQR